MQGVAKLAPGDGNVGLLEVPIPAIRAGHVLIEVKATGVCGTDIHIYHGEYASHPPVIMGHEVAGLVAEVGEGVTNCQVGDGGQGALPVFAWVRPQNAQRPPANFDLIAGALSEPLTCCVHALERTHVEPGETVIVSGPGAIGLLMAQVVKAAGARVLVLGTGADAARLALAQTLGADLAVNVEEGTTQQLVADLTEGVGADVVFECAGVGASAQSCLNLVRRRGRYGQVGLFGKPITWDLDLVCYKELAVHGSFAHLPSAWRKALKLMAAGQVQTRPLVSAILPISEWQAAFDAFERRDGLKIVLTPL